VSKVLVIGDLIADEYRHFTATRLSPEAPVPVLVETKPKYTTEGGAGLTNQQLLALGVKTLFVPMTFSKKERIFADDRLMLRIDEDQKPPLAEYPNGFNFEGFDAVVVSDYGKGTAKYASLIMAEAVRWNLPVFVDAKNNWLDYSGAFAAFPNEKEFATFNFKHVIQKLGARGCSVDGKLVPQTRPHAVMDVSGAGDIFMAAFIHWWLLSPSADPDTKLIRSAEFANHVAGISVEYVGTKVVQLNEIDKMK